MCIPSHHERVFDLDDVRALGSAFTPGELRWITSCDAERRYIRRALSDMEMHCPDHQGARDATDRRYAEWHGTRAERTRTGPRFSMLEITWICKTDSLARVQDPTNRAIVEDHRSGGMVDLDALLGSLVERYDAEYNTLRVELSIQWCHDRPDASRKLSVKDLDHEWVNLLGRCIDAEAHALREVADQAMAEQGELPVHRPRARL